MIINESKAVKINDLQWIYSESMAVPAAGVISSVPPPPDASSAADLPNLQPASTEANSSALQSMLNMGRPWETP